MAVAISIFPNHRSLLPVRSRIATIIRGEPVKCLARALGVSPRTVENWQAEIHTPHLDEALLLAAKFPAIQAELNAAIEEL